MEMIWHDVKGKDIDLEFLGRFMDDVDQSPPDCTDEPGPPSLQAPHGMIV